MRVAVRTSVLSVAGAVECPTQRSGAFLAVTKEVAPEQTLGTHQPAVLHFRRGGARVAEQKLAKLPVRDIGFQDRPAV
jgi:hypothetical protein